MRASSLLRVLPLLALVVGCGHTELSAGRRLAAAGDAAAARGAYERVLADPNAEKWDKEAASEGWQALWVRSHASERAGVRAKVAELEASSLAPAEKRLRVLSLRRELEAFGDTSRELADLGRILERAAEAEWTDVDALASRGRYVAADELASVILATPGLPARFAARARTMRETAARTYQAKAAAASEAPLASALYRDLGAHFLGAAITPAPALAAEALPRVRLEGPPRRACEATVQRVVSAIAPTAGSASLVLRADLDCAATSRDETTTKQATYHVTVPAGTKLETYYDVEQVCTSTPFCVPTTVLGVGGQSYYATQCRDEVSCRPSAVARTREVPVFKDQPRTESYQHVLRTYEASLRGALSVRLEEGSEEERLPVSLSASDKDEAFELPTGPTSRQRRAFDPKISAASTMAKIEGELLPKAREAALRVLARRGDALLRALPVEPVLRAETIFRAALFGATQAEAATRESDGLDRERMLALLAGRDPIPRNDASPPAPVPGPVSRDLPPKPPLRGGYPGYERTMQLELLFGTFGTSDVPQARDGSAPANRGETAFVGAMRFESPVLGDGAPSGFMFLDAFGALFAFGSRTSDDVLGAEHSGTAFKLEADYTAMLGVRLRRLGLFAGARARGLFGNTGEIDTGLGYQVPLCARVELRVVQNLMPTASACALSFVGGEHTSIDAFLPLTREGGVHAFWRFERVTADANLGGYRFGFSDPERLDFSTLLFGIGLGR